MIYRGFRVISSGGCWYVYDRAMRLPISCQDTLVEAQLFVDDLVYPVALAENKFEEVSVEEMEVAMEM